MDIMSKAIIVSMLSAVIMLVLIVIKAIRDEHH